MLDESRVQVNVNKYSAGLRRLKEACVRDLRNPLGAIYAAAEMLIELDAEPTQVKRLATNIHRAAGRIRELLADLHSVACGSRPMAEACDIREVISAASDAAWTATKNHSVQILLEAPEGVELWLMRSRIERVFFNLITNSLEAMATGGNLGQALSRQTLLNHGGDIWAEPGSGARFVIRRPLRSR